MSQRSTHLFASITAAICLVGLVNGCGDSMGTPKTFPADESSCTTADGEHRVCISWSCAPSSMDSGVAIVCSATQPPGVPLPTGKYPCSSTKGGLYCPPSGMGGPVSPPDCTATAAWLICKRPANDPSEGSTGTGGSAEQGTGGVAGSATGAGGQGGGHEGTGESNGSGGVNGGSGGASVGDGTGGVAVGGGTGGTAEGSGSGGASVGDGSGGSTGGNGSGGASAGDGTGGAGEATGSGGSGAGDGSGGCGGSGGSGGTAGGNGTGGSGGSGGSVGGNGSGGTVGSGGAAGGDGSGGTVGSGGASGGSGGAGGGNQGPGCTRTEGYWKNHVDAWPVAALIVGQVNYSKDELVGLFMTETAGDASLILADQLFAALLNQAAGAAVPSAIANALSAAQYWMATHKDADGRLSYGISPSSTDGSAAVALSAVLDDFNNGRAGTPHCR
ncbi:MAG TPA: hypothetical protein VNO55_14585 [Polyangia bacterium]|nr:hypothetical protein [Polyangia bacterium]